MDERQWVMEDNEIIEIPPIKKLCKSLEAKFFQEEERIKRLQEENKKLKDEVWKDEECARLKEENERLRKENLRGFPISEDEWEKIKEWKKNHQCKYRGLKIGSSYQYTFNPIGLGTFGHIKCSCGEEFTFQEP